MPDAPDTERAQIYGGPLDGTEFPVSTDTKTISLGHEARKLNDPNLDLIWHVSTHRPRTYVRSFNTTRNGTVLFVQAEGTKPVA